MKLPGDRFSLHEGYNNLVEEAISGRMVAPRDLTTFEVIGPVMLKTCSNLTVNSKGLNPKLGVVEGLMLVSGEYDGYVIDKATLPADIKLVKTNSDYGKRIKDQMPSVIQLLRDDRWTRRAIAYLPQDHALDTPPTTAIHWMIRNDTLETIVNVRSWDLAETTPLDILSHGILTQVVAKCLNVLPGYMYFTASSVHVYPDTMKLAVAEGDLEFNLGPAWPKDGNYWEAYQLRAKHALQEYATYGVISPGVMRLQEI